LKRQKHRSQERDFVDPEFMEALSEHSHGSSNRDRHAQRKTEQLCRQVQRALNLALADYSDGLGGIVVDAVTAGVCGGRLLVHVIVPAGEPVADIVEALRRETPRLRAEVAKAITRKRAPELSFVPAMGGGGFDE
jgi:ribosome-binding factor A